MGGENFKEYLYMVDHPQPKFWSCNLGFATKIKQLPKGTSATLAIVLEFIYASLHWLIHKGLTQ